jgi:hypothetical protein
MKLRNPDQIRFIREAMDFCGTISMPGETSEFKREKLSTLAVAHGLLKSGRKQFLSVSKGADLLDLKGKHYYWISCTPAEFEEWEPSIF